MGRELAHEVIKKHATTTTASDFFKSLSTEKDFPLSIDQLNDLIKDPALFAGGAIEQSNQVVDEIKKVTRGKIIKVDLQSLI
jgi:adenylosuccinate lyase